MMSYHTLTSKNAKKQGEMPYPILSPISFVNYRLGGQPPLEAVQETGMYESSISTNTNSGFKLVCIKVCVGERGGRERG